MTIGFGHLCRRWTGWLALLTLGTGAAMAQPAACDKPVYLGFETGSMATAPMVGLVLQRQQVRATFFAAADRTAEDGDSLDTRWAPWWGARGAEGHDFVSLTRERVTWLADERGVRPEFRVQPRLGAFAGRTFTWNAAKYCDNITQAADRLAYVTGQPALPLFRAPGGLLSPKLAAATQACGYRHVGLNVVPFPKPGAPSAKAATPAQIDPVVARIRPGDLVLGHLGEWTHELPQVPAGLNELIDGLKARGFCFRTIRQHPDYAGLLTGAAPEPPAAGK